MKNLLFSITALLIITILGTKLLFFNQETQFSLTVLARVELIVLIGLFFAGCGAYFYNSFTSQSLTEPNQTIAPKMKNATIGLALLITAVIGSSFFLNFQKNSLDWDDVALYDARARFMANGMKLSDMISLSQYDSKNSYYYLLYPPFTSQLHAQWYLYQVPLPISVQYALFLTIFAVGLFLLTKDHVGITGALVVTLLTITQENIFKTSVLAYTNLPYTLYVTFGILLLYNYLSKKQLWQLIFGVLFISLSQWIRFLEPSWLAILLGFIIAGYFNFPLKKTIGLLVFMASVCLLEYKTWQYFVGTIAERQSIFKLSALSFIEPVIGVFTGSLLNILIFFCIAWGLPLLLHFSALATISQTKEKNAHVADLFLKLTIFFSIGMYFAGLYFISFQFDWWSEMGGSLIRSSTFLLPLSLFLLSKEVLTYFKKK